MGGLALLLSQLLIMTVWRDAWAGTAANAVLLLVVAHGLLTEGPWSFHAQYLRDRWLHPPHAPGSRFAAKPLRPRCSSTLTAGS